MARDRITDGKRIGQLLSSEIHGHERGALGHLSVAEADTDVEPTSEGAFAYGIDFSAVETDDKSEPETDGKSESGTDGKNERIAAVYVHPNRIRAEFETGVETAINAAGSADLRVRPKAVEPPRALVFVESGADVKLLLNVVRTVAEERLEAVE